MAKVRVVLASAVLMAGACGGENSSGGAPPVSLPGKTNNHGVTTASSETEVELDDFYFGPTFIKTPIGGKVTLQLKNNGKATHTFTSSALGVDQQLAPGATQTINVTVSAPGTTLFICRFHQSQGMQGAFYIG